MSKYGRLVDEQFVLLKYAYENDLKDAIMWIEEYLERIAEDYSVEFEDMLKEYGIEERKVW